ncbi:MAG: hypothetical protein LBG20_00055 [Holosporaceae bacterium]|jgi:hypothetical protein|nr:hypothetical protein [Holosporaceae bacterium]
MKLIFDWSSSFCEEKNDWRGDEAIISLEIFQKECGFAMAKASLEAKRFSNPQKYVKIGVQMHEGDAVELLFSGRLIAFPIGFGDSTVELEFIAEPDDYQAKLAEFSNYNLERYRIVNKHRLDGNHILFDDLFFSLRDLKNPTIFLEGNSKIFHWDMKNGDLSLSDINIGENNFNVEGGEILQNSIRVRLAREPYGTVNLRVSANWIQHEYGIIDVIPMIAAQFAQHKINSFTDIKSGIEKIFSFQNGYRLAHCNIREIDPTGLLDRFSVLSPDFHVQENQSSDVKKVVFRRFYFDGQLVLNWAYRQKRIEFVNVKILNPSSPHGREKNVYLRLNAIQLPKKYPSWNHFTYYGNSDKIQHENNIFECISPHISAENFEADKWKFVQKIPDALVDDMSSSFFSTDRGKNAIKYAMQKVVALINYSSRRTEIDFCIEANKFMFAGVGDQITIHERRFPNGRIVGKITKMRFIGNADRKIIKFTIGCRSADLSRNFDRLNSYEIQIANDVNRINPADIVRKIQIENSPEEQIEMLSRTIASNSSELKRRLKKHATKIRLFLHPLNTTRVITREITLPDFEMEQS